MDSPTKPTSALKRKRTSPFDGLPPEMLEAVLSKLGHQDKKACRQVSSLWYAVIERDLYYNFPLSKETFRDFGARVYDIYELRVDLTGLTFPTTPSATMKESLLSVCKLAFHARVRDENLIWVDGTGIGVILKACRYMKTLSFDFTRFQMESFQMFTVLDLRTVKLDNLITLQLILVCGAMPEFEFAVLRLEAPNLRVLIIERINVSETRRKEDWSVYLEVQRCLVRNRRTLRCLTLVDAVTETTTVNSVPQEPDLLDGLRELRLNCLRISQRAEAMFVDEDLTLLEILLTHQTRLGSLNVDSNSSVVVEPLPGLLRRNRGTLVCLSLNIHLSPPVFDYSVLRELRALADFAFESSSVTDLDIDNVPRGLRRLLWNAPLSINWYEPETFRRFPNLKYMTLGKRAFEPGLLGLGRLALALFGTESSGSSLEMLSLVRPPRPIETGMRTRSYARRMNADLEPALALRGQGFIVNYDNAFVRISRRQLLAEVKVHSGIIRERGWRV